MPYAMTRAEREAFLAEAHVGIIGIAGEGRGPLTVPIWYAYEPGGEVRIVTGRASRKLRLLQRAGRFSLCAQTETPPYTYVTVEGPVIAVEPVDRERHLAPAGALGRPKPSRHADHDAPPRGSRTGAACSSQGGNGSRRRLGIDLPPVIGRQSGTVALIQGHGEGRAGAAISRAAGP